MKSVNEAANKVYASKGIGYKFLTWISRLLDSYSPDQKINQFSINVHKKERNVFENIKIINKNLSLNLNSKPITELLIENRVLFSSAIKKKGTLFTDDGWLVSIPENNSILVNADQKLKIIFSDEGSLNILLNEQLMNQIPDHFKPILEEAFKKAILSVNQYTDYGIFQIVPQSLSLFPESHLKEFIKYYKNHGINSFKFDFFDENLVKQKGIDTGGLKRDYISQLTMSLQEEDSLFHVGKDGLKFPRIVRLLPTVCGNEIISCSQEESEFYSNLGTLMRFSYQDKDSPTGLFFSDVLFYAALEFSHEELDTSFSDLDKEVLLRVAKQLVKQFAKDETSERSNCLDCLDLLEKDCIKNLLKGPEDKATKALNIVAGLGMEYYLDESLTFADVKKIKENPDLFYRDLFEAVFSSKEFIESLNGASLSEILAPIHSLAKGMADGDDWDTLCSLPVAKVTAQIQGELDRQKIHDALYKQTDYVEKEFNWLKAWILNEASNEELREFLRFVSGSTALPPDTQIEVSWAFSGVHPIGHTCRFKIDLLDTDTKENFIIRLKEAIKTNEIDLI